LRTRCQPHFLHSSDISSNAHHQIPIPSQLQPLLYCIAIIMNTLIERTMHIITTLDILPSSFVNLQSRIIHQTMNHPPTVFAALYVTTICGYGIFVFTVLAFSEFFQRKVHNERVFFDRVLVTRRYKAKASASCDSDGECAICLGSFGKNDHIVIGDCILSSWYRMYARTHVSLYSLGTWNVSIISLTHDFLFSLIS